MTCTTMANLYIKHNDFDHAIKYYRKACNVFSFDCIYIGGVYLHKKYIEYNKDKAIAYFKKACEKGEEEGCIKAGETYKNLKNNIKESKVYFYKACSLGYIDYCKQ